MSNLLDYFQAMGEVRLVLLADKYNEVLQDPLMMLNSQIVCSDFTKYDSFYQKGYYLEAIEFNEFYYHNHHSTIGMWLIQLMLVGKSFELNYYIECGLLYMAADPESGVNNYYLGDFTVVSLAKNIFNEFITWRIRHIGNYRFAVYGVSKTAKTYYLTFSMSEVFIKKVNSQFDFGLLVDYPVHINK